MYVIESKITKSSEFPIGLVHYGLINLKNTYICIYKDQ